MKASKTGKTPRGWGALHARELSMPRRLTRTALAMCALALALMALLSYQGYRWTAGDAAAQWDAQTLQYASLNIASGMEETRQLLRQLAEEARLLRMVSLYLGKGPVSYDWMNARSDLANLVNGLIAGYHGIANVAIRLDEKAFTLKESVRPVEPADLAWESLDAGAVGTQVCASAGKPYLVLFTPILASGGERGLLLLQMTPEWIGELLGGDPSLFVLAGEEPLYRDAAMARRVQESPGDFRTASKVLQDSGWRLTLHIDLREATKPMEQILWSIVTGFVACALLALLLSKALLGFITEPIDLLSKSLEESVRTQQPVQLVFRGRRRKLTDAMMTYLLVVCIAPILAYLGSYSLLASSVIRETMVSTAVRQTRQAVRSADAFLEHADRISASATIDRNVQEILWGRKEGREPNIAQYAELLETAGQYGLSFEMQIELYDERGGAVLSTSGRTAAMPEALLGEYQRTNNPFPTLEIDGQGLHIWRRVRSVLPEHTNLALLGYAHVAFSAASLSNAYVGDAAGMRAALAERADALTGMPERADGLRLRETREGLYVAAPMAHRDLSMVAFVDREAFEQDRSRLMMINLIGGLLFAGVILYVAYMQSNRFTRSVEILQYNLMGWQAGGMETNLSMGVEDHEILRLARVFNTMNERILALRAAAYEAEISDMQLEAELRRAELNALQAQIHPHFLYNTLESMKFMVREHRMETTLDMIDMLGDLFRAAATERKTLVPLSVEAEYARAYISLQMIRFEDKLAVDMDIEDQALRAAVPKLILQPLIENAIQHGRRSDGSRLNVRVIARREGKRLSIVIRNDGLPMTPQALQALQAKLGGGRSDTGIGLVNVHRRLTLYFGDAYGASVQNVKERGVEVVLTLPFLEEEPT